MEGLSDSFAELGSMILTLTGQPFTPEFDSQVQYLNQKFAAIQEVVNDVLKLRNEEIADLHKQVDKLEAEKIRLEEEFSTTESTHKYDELCAALESRNAKNEKLEAEKEILKKRVKTVEDQIMELKDDLQKAKRENMSSDREIKNLTDELDDVKEENQTLHSDALVALKERQTLQGDVWDMKDSLQKLEINNTTLQRKVEDLERKIHEPDDDLILGELCLCVQSMIFQQILPPEFCGDTKSYKIENICDEGYFPLLFNNDEHKISAANEAWRELQKKLKWQESDVEEMIMVMKVIQQGRNVVAHPELTEDILTELTQRMNDAGKVKGARSADVVKRLINVWKQLKMMA